MAQAEIRVMDAQIADIDLKLARTAVKAPVSGVVSARTAKIGAIAMGGSTQPLFSIIRNGETAETGEIVVALVDEQEATLKRLRRKGASIALEPANPAYETRIFGPDRVKIQGKLVSLVRRY